MLGDSCTGWYSTEGTYTHYCRFGNILGIGIFVYNSGVSW